jgi:hypothetical protein
MRTPPFELDRGLCPPDPPARSLGRRFVASLRSRGSLAAARSRLSNNLGALSSVRLISRPCGLRPPGPSGPGDAPPSAPP